MTTCPDPYSFATCDAATAELCQALPELADGAAAALTHLARYPTRDGCAHMLTKLGRLERHLHALRGALERDSAQDSQGALSGR